MEKQNENLIMLNIIAKSWSDPEYKERLLRNPEEVLAAEGLRIRLGARVRVVEQMDDEILLLLPAKPEGELTIGNISSAVAASAAMTSPFAAMTFFSGPNRS